MEFQDFLRKIADMFGRRNWADFSIEETSDLRDIFERIDSDAYERGYNEAKDESETEYNDCYDDGYEDGYQAGLSAAEPSETESPIDE